MKLPETRLKTFSTSSTHFRSQILRIPWTEKSSSPTKLKRKFFQVKIYIIFVLTKFSAQLEEKKNMMIIIERRFLRLKGWINVRVCWCVKLQIIYTQSDNQQTCCFAS